MQENGVHSVHDVRDTVALSPDPLTQDPKSARPVTRKCSDLWSSNPTEAIAEVEYVRSQSFATVIGRRDRGDLRPWLGGDASALERRVVEPAGEDGDRLLVHASWPGAGKP